jgi:glucose-1-phosphate adenylyltransferase
VSRPRILTVVLAGGAGGRLELLTERRAKPAVPFAASYRLIDFPLSNALHSGISDVWVVQQFNPVSLSDHLANGRPWDLDRTSGGLLVLQPHRGTGKEGWHQGTADALWRHAELIREFAPDALVVVSADAVYKLDYDAVVAAHLDASGAAVTMVTTEVAPQDADRYGVVQVSGGKVTEYVYKPDEPSGNLVSNEVFVFSPRRVLGLLDELAADSGDEGLEDLGHALLPTLVDAGEARQFAYDDYWRDVGTVDAYWSAHMDLLGEQTPIVLDDPRWPITTRGGHHGPARIAAGAQVDDSLLAPGSRVAGTVVRSVVAPGVVVEAGAVVRDSVLLPGAVVRSDAEVTRAVVDDDVVVGRAARVGGEGDVALVGCAARLPDGEQVPAGARYPAEPEE